MGGDEARPSRLPWAALGFACAGALACWNALAAPLGLPVAAAAAAVGGWAMARRRGRRGVALAALLLGGSAAVVAGGVLIAASFRLAAGEPPGEAVVTPRSAAEVRSLLDAAAERTRPARARAARQLGTQRGPAERRGGAAAPDGGAPEADMDGQ